MTKKFSEIETVEQAIVHLENYCRENFSLDVDFTKALAIANGSVHVILIDQSDDPEINPGQEIWRFLIDIDDFPSETIDIVLGTGEVCVF